jgi:hypothetical protein
VNGEGNLADGGSSPKEFNQENLADGGSSPKEFNYLKPFYLSSIFYR